MQATYKVVTRTEGSPLRRATGRVLRVKTNCLAQAKCGVCILGALLMHAIGASPAATRFQTLLGQAHIVDNEHIVSTLPYVSFCIVAKCFVMQAN